MIAPQVMIRSAKLEEAGCWIRSTNVPKALITFAKQNHI